MIYWIVGFMIIFNIMMWRFDRLLFSSNFRLNQERIWIKDTPHDGLGSLISQFLEYLIFAKYSCLGYKNRVRSNLRLFSAIYLTTLVCSVTLLILETIFNMWNINSSEMDKSGASAIVATILGILGFLISTFVLERNHLYRKWEYLAGLYNKTIETEPSLKRDAMEAALALDIIEMEMWSHRSFKPTVIKVLIEAYYVVAKVESNKLHSKSLAIRDVYNLSDTRRLDKHTAYTKIEQYQATIMQRQKDEIGMKKAS